MGIRSYQRSGARSGKGGAVATFVSLINWTDQGIKNFRESGKRAQAFSELVQKSGGSVKAIYWTLGEYDLVAITEAPDAETATSVLLQVGSLGNVRSTTLEAFDRDAFERIVAKSG
jgi:uncharacterized protein with GYD domain